MQESLNILGLVVAKENSNRLPNKNIQDLDGRPLFYHSVEPLLYSKMVDDVYVATNSKYIKDYCRDYGIDTIWRGVNVSQDEEPIFDVIKFVYKSIDREYDYVVCILANCPGVDEHDIDNGLSMMVKNNLKDVRSFDDEGVENGVVIFESNYLLEKKEVSTYIGCMKTNSKEIHYKEDLDKLRKIND